MNAGMSRFTVRDTPLSGLKTIERQSLGDARGFLSRLFCADDLAPAGWSGPIAQINHTRTEHTGTVRGLHCQLQPYGEIKLVSCVRGEVFDVAVDLRRRSPTFLQWHGEILSAANHRALLIPHGFAHGFQALTDEVELLYCHSSPHVPAAEFGLHPQDAYLAIDWPLPVIGLSARDAAHARLDARFDGVLT